MGNRAFTFPQAQTFHPQEPSWRAVPGDTRAFSISLTSAPGRSGCEGAAEQSPCGKATTS